MIVLNQKQVLSLHWVLLKLTGGNASVNDISLLDMSLNSAFQSFCGEDFFKTPQEKGAKLGHSLVSNHAFVDGNKRIGILVMLSFLQINGVKLAYTKKEIINLGLKAAQNKICYKQMLNWVKQHEVKLYEKPKPQLSKYLIEEYQI